MGGANGAGPDPGGSRIEQHTIGVVPETERHGRPRDLFTMWFSASLGPLTVVTGALAAQVFGLSFWWGVLALTGGNLFGAFLMALHSAQGPQLGVPQMIQSRGQFGMKGAVLVVVIALVMYQGFFASNLVTGAQSVQAVWGGFDLKAAIVLGALVSFAVMVVGHDLIHRTAAFATWVVGAVTIAALVWIPIDGLPGGFFSAGSFTWAGFVGTAAVAVMWQIAYAPYVSDYSRYMPSSAAGVRSTLWCTYWGTVLGTLLPMLTGLFLGLMVEDDVIAGMDGVYGTAFAKVVAVCFAIVTMLTNSMNLYGAVLSLITAVQTFAARWVPGARARVALGVVLGAVSIAIALSASDDFMHNWSTFITVLTYVLIPWTAINLADFYLVHKGRYDVPSFFAPDGGVYGRWNVPALAVYVVGILVQLPFMVVEKPFSGGDMYVGAVAAHLQQTDVAWIVGLAVSALLYLVVVRVTARSDASDSQMQKAEKISFTEAS